MRRHAALFAAALALAACKPGDDPPPDPTAAAQPAQPTVIDDIAKAPMDKASALEQDVIDSQNRTDEAMDKALEEPEGGG